MKKTTILIGVSLLINNLYGGFDFGGSDGTGCDGGSGTFQQQIEYWNNDPEKAVTVGTIPKDLKDIYISLKSDEDVDIRLYNTNGEKIVHWPSGLLSGSGKDSINYHGVIIEYSGYNGDGTGLGHEYIKISGTTQNDFIMKAFGYKAGYAKVDYSWAGKANCSNSSTPKASGSGDFEQQIFQNDIVTVGDIPPKVNNLYITLKSDEDVDIQLYDKDNGTKIIVWPDGILHGANRQTTDYKGMKLEWSGYNGDGTGLGHEYIKITGETTCNLTMKAYGYKTGYAKVHYEWGKDTTEPTPTSTPTPTPTLTSCDIITDDSSYNDVFPNSNIKWSSSGDSVKDIEDAFNYARAKDSTINKSLVMPSQSIWDDMDNQEKALYLLNKERYDRGIKPFEGIDQNVIDVAQAYAELLYTKGKFGHNEDGSPWDRLNRVDVIKNNHDFFKYGENLYTSAGSANYTKNPIAKAIYSWIYDDAGSAWGHRKFALANGLNDNSGDIGAEGLIGFGIKRGDEYGYYPGWKSTIVVMNAFDPSSSWNHTNTKSVSICTNDSTETSNDVSDKKFIVDISKGIVIDTETNLMWQNAELAHKTPDEAIAQCKNLNFAGYSDWRLPTKAESKRFHSGMNAQGDVPKQAFSGCTAEVVSDGYVKTKKGADTYGGTPGDSINFSGGANVRCVRDN